MGQGFLFSVLKIDRDAFGASLSLDLEVGFFLWGAWEAGLSHERRHTRFGSSPELLLAGVDSVLSFVTFHRFWLFPVFGKGSTLESGARGRTDPSRAPSPPSPVTCDTERLRESTHGGTQHSGPLGKR